MRLNEELTQVLASLNLMKPAVLAGGYLRDTLMGRPVKDVDFFIEGPLEVLDLQVRFPAAKLEPFSEWLAYRGREVRSVWNLGTTQDGLPMQLIELLPGLSVTERAEAHDFGLCQIWTNDGVHIHTTEAFSLDATNKTFTLKTCEDASELERSLRRYQRLRQKYPEFTLVVPEEFNFE